MRTNTSPTQRARRARKPLPLLLAGCLLGAAVPAWVAAPASGAEAPPAASPATVPAAAPAGARVTGDAAKDLDTYKALKPAPVDMSKRQDKEYIKSYMEQMKSVMKERAEFAKEFAARYPENADTSKMLFERWMNLLRLGDGDPVREESAKFLEAHPDAPNKKDILFLRAEAALDPATAKEAKEAVDAYIKDSPKDERIPQLLTMLAGVVPDTKSQVEINQRVLKEYPESQAAEGAKMALEQLGKVGKPFELAFTDAIGGKAISIKDLKGKVVVVDFWATWCGPCVAEMPKLKQLYADYHDKGVEFVGVSLDQPESDGGLKALKEFVHDNGIGWPQYYQGNGWESEFSKGWGINSIPRMFILDGEGRLYSPNARGQLEVLIPELLKKSGGSASAADDKAKG